MSNSIFPDDAAETTRPDLPAVPSGHLSDQKIGGRSIAPEDGTQTVFDGGWPDDWKTVEDPPATDEPTDEGQTGAHRKRTNWRDVNKSALLAIPIGIAGLGLAFWGIHSASASGPEVSKPRTAVESAEPTAIPGPTVTHTVRGPRVVVTETVRARVTVRVTVTATHYINRPGKPGPTTTKTVTKCPNWGCDG